MAIVSTKILDHIIHLAPPGTLKESIDVFRKLGFTVSPGGTHGSGLTANALVIFPDATYLELAHYIRPPPSDSTHPWGKKQPGWIDYVFLGNGGTPSIAETINARAEQEGTGVRYEAEVQGGRKREDGKLVEWTITGREGELSQRGRLPFFCGDLTPREWRVPLEPRSNSQHQNGATGVAYIKALVAPENFESTIKELTSVLGTTPNSSTPVQATWTLDAQPLRHATSGKDETPKLIISAARDDEERTYLEQRGPGVYEVGFAVAGALGRREESTGHGRISWVAS